jgi:hypothetical protein
MGLGIKKYGSLSFMPCISLSSLQPGQGNLLPLMKSRWMSIFFLEFFWLISCRIEGVWDES